MLAQVGTFAERMTAGRGYVAIAIVVLGRWHPVGVALAALLFGAATALQFLFQTLGLAVPYQLFLMLPYVLTLLALAGARGSGARASWISAKDVGRSPASADAEDEPSSTSITNPRTPHPTWPGSKTPPCRGRSLVPVRGRRRLDQDGAQPGARRAGVVPAFPLGKLSRPHPIRVPL